MLENLMANKFFVDESGTAGTAMSGKKTSAKAAASDL